MGESIGVEFGIEVGSYLGLSGGYGERKVDGYSLEFDRGIVGLTLLGTDAVAVAAISVQASALISGMR